MHKRLVGLAAAQAVYCCFPSTLQPPGTLLRSRRVRMTVLSDEVETAWVLLNNGCACIDLLIEDREAADGATRGEIRALVDARAVLAPIEERLREEAGDGGIRLLSAQVWERRRGGEFWLVASEGKAFLEGLRAYLGARREFHGPISQATAALEDILGRRLPSRSG